jgi:UDP:flavonoid glycosyltransferase YjiC (YdhE family)
MLGLAVRVLMATTRGAGHFNPLVPFASAFLDTGEEVLVAGPHEAVPMIERVGLAAWGFADPPPEETGPVFAGIFELTPEEANERVISEVFGRIDTRAALPGIGEAVAEWKPDVVVRETAEFGSLLAAERAGLPHARVAVGLADAQMLPIAAGALDELRAGLDLPGDPRGERARGGACLSLAPASVDDPGETSTQRFREAAREAAALPDWWPGDARPLVYLSFGSVAPTMGFWPGLYRAAVDALAEVPARLLVTVGETQDPADLGPVPENVRVESWVPQGDVLPHAAAMVCHGGYGSVLGPLLAGVPLAVLPLFADQPHNAARVAAAGAGVAVEGGPPAAGALGEAVARLLDDGGYREAAERIAAEARALPSVDRAVDVLRGLAGSA